ncbi:glycoside hydrolase family 3 protein [Paraglaciecola sp.]|uniref:glycoside hydrolase family 3 protein n=1 Tax=Paraglaciecola sp. TaxID=1920173 RepID=UPI0030F49D9D
MFDPKKVLTKLTLKEKVGQLFFRTSYQMRTEISDELLTLFDKGVLGNVILFAGTNIQGVEQCRELTNKLQEIAQDSQHKIPLFIGIDQEGGQLSPIFRGCEVFPGNMNLGVVNDYALTKKVGRFLGNQVSLAGGNMNFCPVLDVAYDAKFGTPIIDNRTLSSDPNIVANLGCALIEGIAQTNVLACAKHFPGQRLVLRDTHHELDIIDYSMERLEKVELLPFKKAIAAKIPALMTHHCIYKALDDLPATLSSKVTNYLRKQLGFQGLIVSDDLCMDAITDQFGTENAMIKSINAGINLLIMTDHHSWNSEFVIDAVKKGIIDINTINDSVYRILGYKSRLKSAENHENNIKQTIVSGLNRKAEKKTALAVARRSIVQYGTDLKPNFALKNKRVSVILGNPIRLVMSDTVNRYQISLREEIRSKGYADEVHELVLPLEPNEMEVLSFAHEFFMAEVVIYCTCNAFHWQQQLKPLDIRWPEKDQKVIGVALRSPEDAKLLQTRCDQVFITGGITPLTIQALVETIFGDNKAVNNSQFN